METKFSFSSRIDDMEVRISSEPHIKAEIVKWGNDNLKVGYNSPFCYTLAFWNETKEGYELKFVLDRPFEVDMTIFMQLAKWGQQQLNKIYESKD